MICHATKLGSELLLELNQLDTAMKGENYEGPLNVYLKIGLVHPM